MKTYRISRFVALVASGMLFAGPALAGDGDEAAELLAKIRANSVHKGQVRGHSGGGGPRGLGNDSCATPDVIVCGGSVTDDNTFATDDPTDPLPTCRNGGNPQLSTASMWFTFVATQASARVDTLSSPGGDSILSVYSGTCGNLTEIGCNDDMNSTNYLSVVCVENLNVGSTYYVQLRSWDGIAIGTYVVSVTCPCPPPPGRPANDQCGAAQLLPVPTPATVVGATNAATGDIAPACDIETGVTSHGVWYKVIGTGNNITASLCSLSDYDTKLSVYCGGCTTLNCIAGDDDGCDTFASRVGWCSVAGREYLICVHGFRDEVGMYTLDLSDEGSPCTTVQDCDPRGACCVAGGGCVTTTATDCAAQSGQYLGDGAACSNAVRSFAAPGTPENVPDNGPAGIPFTVNATGTATIDQLVVELALTHSWCGDMSATITRGATTVTLFDRIGLPSSDPAFGDSSNFGGVYRFSDAASGDIWAVAASNGTNFTIPSGSYRPSRANDGGLPSPSLAAFNGQTFAGNWTIRVFDHAVNDFGSVISARIMSTASTSACQAGCPLPGCDSGGVDADLNNDCEVGLGDLTVLLSHFGGPGPIGDLDGGGDVGLNDLTLLLSRFGTICHP